MPVSPYEWNESIRQRNEYIEDRLKDGSPVVAVSYDGGVLMLCLRQSQRKIYEIYDKLMFSAIGNQADIETIRTGAIDVAHREGFSRSPDDVSIQRIVGFAVSPAIKKVYADPFAAPIVVRGLFAELGKTIETDQYFVVGYDGEFTRASGYAVIAGTDFAEERALAHLKTETEAGSISLSQALRAAVYAWGIGRKHLEEEGRDEGDLPQDRERSTDVSDFLSEHLSGDWVVEAAVLERETRREGRYRPLTPADLAEVLASYR